MKNRPDVLFRWLGLLCSSAVLAALASPVWALPSQLATSLDGGAGTPSAVAVSSDGVVVAVAGSTGLSVWDLRSVTEGAQASGACSSSGAEDVIFVGSGGYGERFYVACSGGGVAYVDIDTSTVPVGLTVSDKITVNFGEGDPVGLVHAADDGGVHAVVQDGATYSLDRIPLATSSGDSEPSGFLLSGTVTGVAVASTGTPLVVARSDGYLSDFARSGDIYASPTTLPLFPLGTLSDVLVSAELGVIFASDTSNDAVWAIAIGTSTAVEWGSGFSSPVSMVQGTDSAQPILWVADQDGAISAWNASEEVVVDISSSVSGLVDLAVASESEEELFAVASDGSLLLFHDRPVVSGLSVSAETVTSEDSFTLSFSADQAGLWDLRAGGDSDPESGSSLASGELDAEEVVAVPLSASDLSEEGSNRLFVFVTADDATGLDSVVVVLDTPPDKVADPSVGIGDERLAVSWMASDESDLATYELYLSDAEFTEEDLPTFSVTDSEGDSTSFPLELAAGEPSVTQSYSVEGLVNGTTYWVAVRAIDEGGLVGPLSELASGAPAATCGAAECASDPGCSCAQGPATAASARGLFLLSAALLGLLALRRRWWWLR